jgi:hypothetical protein
MAAVRGRMSGVAVNFVSAVKANIWVRKIYFEVL